MHNIKGAVKRISKKRLRRYEKESQINIIKIGDHRSDAKPVLS
jgi:hypothetical protein